MFRELKPSPEGFALGLFLSYSRMRDILRRERALTNHTHEENAHQFTGKVARLRADAERAS